jgi:rhodanese-related sulfurtransferase
MKITHPLRLSCLLVFLLCFSYSAVAEQAAATKTAEPAAETKAAPDWFYHAIIDDLKNAPEGAVIIDSRPGARKYIKGHIPGALSIPLSNFDKMTDKLPQDKATPLIFYCGGLKCKLSHKSAVKAEALGYKNSMVYANGYPHWKKQGNVGAVTVEYIKKVVSGGKSKVVLIDSRPKKRKYDKGHIPGAISIPDTEFEQKMSMLPEDKSTPLIFYCGGLKCKLSIKSAKKALAAGYTNVRYFPTGFPSWKKSGGEVAKAGESKEIAIKAGGEDGTISIESFLEIVEKKPDSVYIIDVRDADEFAEGSLKIAKNIPIDKLGDQVESLPSDKPIIFICSAGARSGEAYDTVAMLREGLKMYFLNAEPTYNKDGTYSFKPVE